MVSIAYRIKKFIKFNTIEIHLGNRYRLRQNEKNQ